MKADGPIGVFVAVYDAEATADAALKSVDDLSKRHGVEVDIYDQAKVTRKEDGSVEVRTSQDVRHTARDGAAVGALFGLLFPPSIIVWGAVGGAAGAAWNKVRDQGFVDRGFLSGVGDEMTPGRSAIMVVTEPQHLATLAETVPTPLRTAEHTFESADAGAVREWIGSLPSQPQAQA